MLRLPVLAPALVAWPLAAAAPARVDTARHAVVIGDHRGAADDPLRGGWS
jgi:hypothetical protein